tara:strand:+ start:768 stop:1448 length:681 start_codon:yes stop_codon:yes gene_type:complete
MSNYTILICVHNEETSIPKLLKGLEHYHNNNHEILIIDDGSQDETTRLLKNCNFINVLFLKKNEGKGSALRKGIAKAKNEKIIVFDGDLELDSSEIEKLMILDKKKNIYSAMGYRFKNLNPLKSNFDWGNFMFTSFFNIIFKSNHKDILCCAKSFYINQRLINILSSKGFEIDVELASLLTIRNKLKGIPQISLKYNRRTIQEGKKLQISDGWKILAKIIKMTKFL